MNGPALSKRLWGAMCVYSTVFHLLQKVLPWKPRLVHSLLLDQVLDLVSDMLIRCLQPQLSTKVLEALVVQKVSLDLWLPTVVLGLSSA